MLKQIHILLKRNFTIFIRDKSYFRGYILMPLVFIPLITIIIALFLSPKSTYNIGVEPNIYDNMVKIVYNQCFEEKIKIITISDISKEKAKTLINNQKIDVGVYKEGQKYILLYEPRLQSSIDIANILENALLEYNIQIANSNNYENIIKSKKRTTDESDNMAIAIISLLILVITMQEVLNSTPHIVRDKTNKVLPTLLISKVKRISIVFSNAIYLIVLALLSTALTIIGIIIVSLITQNFTSLDNFKFLTNYRMFISIGIVLISVAIMSSSFSLLISAISKNNRDASMFSSNIGIVCIIISGLVFTELQLYQFIYFVPVVGSIMCIKNIFLNSLNPITQLIPTLSINLIISAIVFYFANKLYKNNELLTRE